MAFSADDTVHAFSTHHSVFTREGKFVRSGYVLDGVRVLGASALQNGQLLLQAIIPTADLAGYPLHVVNARNQVIRSFGALPGAAYVGDFWEQFRAVAVTDSGDIWSAAPNRQQFELWSQSGKLLRVLTRECSWCTTWTHWSGEPDIDEPPPVLNALALDSQGRLWVLTNVKDAGWRATADRRTEARKVPSVADYHRQWDSIIDVFDVSTGALLKSQRFPDSFATLLPGAFLVNLTEAEDGDIVLDVSRLRLEGAVTPRKERMK